MKLRSSVSCSRADSSAEFGSRRLQRLGEAGDADETRVADAAFDAADVRGVEIGFLGGFKLREIQNLAALAHVEAEGCEGAGARRFGHAGQRAG